jgi:hypothetical protein
MYAGFADQVFKLPEEFDDEAIINLVKSYLT